MAVRDLFCCALLLALLSACDDGVTRPRDDDDDDGTGELMPAEERAAAIVAVEQRLGELSAAELEGDALNEAIAGWLAEQPEFEEVGIDSSSSVWARFRDGRLLIVANNLGILPPGNPATVDGGTGSGRIPGDAADFRRSAGLPSLEPAPRATGPFEVPESRRARLLHTFTPGTHFANGAAEAIGEMSQMLADAGYTVRTDAADASVAGLRTISGDGFFYLNTHGGRGRNVRGEDASVFVLQTSTPVSMLTLLDTANLADLAAGRLAFLTAQTSATNSNGQPVYDTRFAITSSFVAHYMSFSPNSLVFLNVCWSASTSEHPASMVLAFQQHGASVVLGWDRLAADRIVWDAAKYLTDRLLGSNRFEPHASRQRPFPLEPVLAWMHNAGFDHHDGSELSYRPATPTGAIFGLLRPTIERVQIDTLRIASPVGAMTLYGRFGTDPGPSNRGVVVRDGASEVPLLVLPGGWTPDSIRVAPINDAAAPGFSGDVVVIVRERESNPRRLHAWHGTATYTDAPAGSLRLVVDMDIVGRFDPDSVRTEPGQPAQANQRVQVFYVQPYPPVEARWTASGSHALSDCTLTWSGAGTLSSAMPVTGLTYTFVGALEPQPRDFVVRQLQVSDADGYTETCTSSQQRSILVNAMAFRPPTSTEFVLRFDVDEQWRIVGGTTLRLGQSPTPTLFWPTIAPIPAYDPRQPR